jgi:hypothetical protein
MIWFGLHRMSVQIENEPWMLRWPGKWRKLVIFFECSLLRRKNRREKDDWPIASEYHFPGIIRTSGFRSLMLWDRGCSFLSGRYYWNGNNISHPMLQAAHQHGCRLYTPDTATWQRPFLSRKLRARHASWKICPTLSHWIFSDRIKNWISGPALIFWKYWNGVQTKRCRIICRTICILHHYYLRPRSDNDFRWLYFRSVRWAVTSRYLFIGS